jgi:hypothetical protein
MMEGCLVMIALKQKCLLNVSDMRGTVSGFLFFTMTQYRVFIL